MDTAWNAGYAHPVFFQTALLAQTTNRLSGVFRPTGELINGYPVFHNGKLWLSRPKRMWLVQETADKEANSDLCFVHSSICDEMPHQAAMWKTFVKDVWESDRHKCHCAISSLCLHCSCSSSINGIFHPSLHLSDSRPVFCKEDASCWLCYVSSINSWVMLNSTMTEVLAFSFGPNQANPMFAAGWNVLTEGIFIQTSVECNYATPVIKLGGATGENANLMNGFYREVIDSPRDQVFQSWSHGTVEMVYKESCWVLEADKVPLARWPMVKDFFLEVYEAREWRKSALKMNFYFLRAEFKNANQTNQNNIKGKFVTQARFVNGHRVFANEDQLCLIYYCQSKEHWCIQDANENILAFTIGKSKRWIDTVAINEWREWDGETFAESKLELSWHQLPNRDSSAFPQSYAKAMPLVIATMVKHETKIAAAKAEEANNVSSKFAKEMHPWDVRSQVSSTFKRHEQLFSNSGTGADIVIPQAIMLVQSLKSDLDKLQIVDDERDFKAISDDFALKCEDVRRRASGSQSLKSDDIELQLEVALRTRDALIEPQRQLCEANLMQISGLSSVTRATFNSVTASLVALDSLTAKFLEKTNNEDDESECDCDNTLPKLENCFAKSNDIYQMYDEAESKELLAGTQRNLEEWATAGLARQQLQRTLLASMQTLEACCSQYEKSLIPKLRQIINFTRAETKLKQENLRTKLSSLEGLQSRTQAHLETLKRLSLQLEQKPSLIQRYLELFDELDELNTQQHTFEKQVAKGRRKGDPVDKIDAELNAVREKMATTRSSPNRQALEFELRQLASDLPEITFRFPELDPLWNPHAQATVLVTQNLE